MQAAVAPAEEGTADAGPAAKAGTCVAGAAPAGRSSGGLPIAIAVCAAAGADTPSPGAGYGYGSDNPDLCPSSPSSWVPCSPPATPPPPCWAAAAAAAIADLADPGRRPAALAALAADPMAGCDVLDSEAWPDFVAAVPGAVQEYGRTLCDAVAVITAVGAAAAADSPGRLCQLTRAVVDGLDDDWAADAGGKADSAEEAAGDDPAADLALSLLREVAASWACFSEDLLQEAAAAAAAAVAVAPRHGAAGDFGADPSGDNVAAAAPPPAPANLRLARLAASDPTVSWWRRWASTPKVARLLFPALAAGGDLERHAVACASASSPGVRLPRHAALSIAVTASAVACAAGREALGGGRHVQLAAHAVARAAIMAQARSVKDAASAGLLAMAEAHSCGAEDAFPCSAICVLVDALVGGAIDGEGRGDGAEDKTSGAGAAGDASGAWAEGNASCAEDEDALGPGATGLTLEASCAEAEANVSGAAEAGENFSPAADRAARALAALCCTPAGADAVLWYGTGGENLAGRPSSLPLPPYAPRVFMALNAGSEAMPCLARLRTALATDRVGRLHLDTGCPPTIGALAAAVASRTFPCCLGALAAVGADAAEVAAAWLAGPGAAVPGSDVDRVSRAAAALATLEAPAREAAAAAAVAGVPVDDAWLPSVVQAVSAAAVADAAAQLLRVHGATLRFALAPR